MKFIRFKKNNEDPHIGVLIGEQKVLDLTSAGRSYDFFRDMVDFIKRGDKALDLVKKLLESPPEEFVESLNKEHLRILPPIAHPGHNIYCVGLNYVDHNKEFSGKNSDLPEFPIIFSKSPNSIIGPEEYILSHSDITKELDYEAELGVVLGKGGKNIPKEKAWEYVFGYTIINDVTARDLQRNHKQWFLGKSLDTFCPIGPWIVHKSGLSKPVGNLNIKCTVNGELRQSSNTQYMIFDIPTLISTISQGHTLEAGNIIATGTCAGVGMGFDPPRYLKSGDVVEIEIEEIGVLRNIVSDN